MTRKSNMSLERTYLSLTLFQESAYVVVKPYKDLMYLYTRSIFILMLDQRECPRYKKKPLKIQPYRPCAVIMSGWPEKRSDCPAYLHAYWNYRDELPVADGLILKGKRIVIPESLQPDVLKQLHSQASQS